MAKPLTIANALAFWGDWAEAPAQTLAQMPNLDYLTLDYLSERSLATMARQVADDHALGYAREFLSLFKTLVPFWEKGHKFKLVTNAGGLNPDICARKILDILQKSSRPDLTVGVVWGDNVLPSIKSESNHPLFQHLETQEPATDIASSLLAANAYLGAEPIAECLNSGVDIVITGRVGDPSMAVGPCLAHYGWKANEYDKIAGALMAGHLIQSGTQVTGGSCTHWLELEDPLYLGYPVVEMSESGDFVITKPPDTGGEVSERTVKEQLLYEIGNPTKYLSPDATVSLMSMRIKEVGKDRVQVTGAIGSPPPPTYKVSASYAAGYRTEGLLPIFGRDADVKGYRCGEIVLRRLNQAGFDLEKCLVECLGTAATVPIPATRPRDQKFLEVILRITVANSKKEPLEQFNNELNALFTSGPQGLMGNAAIHANIHPVSGFWPCLIERERVTPQVRILRVVNP